MIYIDNDALRRAIERLMSDGKERTRRQIAVALDTTTSRIRYTLQSMLREGAIITSPVRGTNQRYRARREPIIIEG